MPTEAMRFLLSKHVQARNPYLHNSRPSIAMYRLILFRKIRAPLLAHPPAHTCPHLPCSLKLARYSHMHSWHFLNFRALFLLVPQLSESWPNIGRAEQGWPDLSAKPNRPPFLQTIGHHLHPFCNRILDQTCLKLYILYQSSHILSWVVASQACKMQDAVDCSLQISRPLSVFPRSST